MRTTVDIPEELLRNARELGGKRTCRETVIAALEEYVRVKRVARVIAVRGTVDLDTDVRKLRKSESRRLTQIFGKRG